VVVSVARIACPRFMMRQRDRKKRKVVTMPERSVGKGVAGPPESNLEIGKAMVDSLRLGAVVGGDGGKAIRSQVKLASVIHGGSKNAIPLVHAVHGRQPKKQFTRLDKRSKAEIPPELEKVLRTKGRWDDASSSVRFVGGNQAAESEWGTSGQLMTQKAVHRAGAKFHSTAHACSALFLSNCPGLSNLGRVMSFFYQECMDKADPATYFTRSGWTSAGSADGDIDAQRVCATAKAASIDQDLDKEIRDQAKKRPAAGGTPVTKRARTEMVKRPAAKVAKRPASQG
jgi:hypothetical protein